MGVVRLYAMSAPNRGISNETVPIRTIRLDSTRPRRQWVNKTLVVPVVIRVALTQDRRIPQPEMPTL